MMGPAVERASARSTFESQYSSEEMSAALDFAYSGGVDVKGEVSAGWTFLHSYVRILDKI